MPSLRSRLARVLGAVAHFAKAMTVAKLRLARDRVRKRDGKCEGRKSFAEMEIHLHDRCALQSCRHRR